MDDLDSLKQGNKIADALEKLADQSTRQTKALEELVKQLTRIASKTADDLPL